MFRRWAKAHERLAMRLRAVAHVAGPGVAGVGGVEIHHDAVAGDLGDDRGGGDGEGAAVALDNCGGGAGQVQAATQIDLIGRVVPKRNGVLQHYRSIPD